MKAIISYYMPSLIDLFTRVQALQDNPHEAFEECYAIQQVLIRKIMYVERKIRQPKSRISELKKQLAIRQTKEKAQEIKITIDNLHQQVEEYKNILTIFRSIGDAVAFTYLSKWDIKPMAFKPSAGFLSGKEGFRVERWFLKKLFSIPVIAILNDLTNNLRYGDITIIKEEIPWIIEVKSNKQQVNKKQLEGVQKINQYLWSDEVEGLYYAGKQSRVSMHSKERNHISQINDLISQALKNGFSFAEVEKGLVYYVDVFGGSAKLEESFQRINEIFSTPIVFGLNAAKYDNRGHYPFTLSLKDPIAIYAFYAGILKIMLVIDFKVIVDKLALQNLTVEYLDDPNCSLKITNMNYHDSSHEFSEGYASRHLFGRLFFEFMSLERNASPIYNPLPCICEISTHSALCSNGCRRSDRATYTVWIPGTVASSSKPNTSLRGRISPMPSPFSLAPSLVPVRQSQLVQVSGLNDSFPLVVLPGSWNALT